MNDTILQAKNAFALSADSTAEAVNQSIEHIEMGHFSLESVSRGLLGILSLLLIAFLFCKNKKAINWKLVGIGLGSQILIAVGILYLPFVRTAFEMVGGAFIKILDFTKEGSEYLLGSLLNVDSMGFIFAFQVLPTVIFFSALISLLFYLGIIQKLVYGLAWLMSRSMKLSGAESLSVAGNIFLGQTESPILIKAYLEKMNKSEIMLVMTGGMATMAGGVLAAYITFLGGTDPVLRLEFAKHLLAASVMAAPGAVVFSKILFPQTEGISMNIEVNKEKIGKNVLDAISSGTGEGLKLAANVGAMLLVFISMIAMLNYILSDFMGSMSLDVLCVGIIAVTTAVAAWYIYGKPKKTSRILKASFYALSALTVLLLVNTFYLRMGHGDTINAWIIGVTGGEYNEFSLEFILGYAFSPLMWLLGVCAEDMDLVGCLVGEKLIMTEFVAYTSLADFKNAALFADPKSVIMATYMLCGFANFASVGIQIGGIGSLAPGIRVWLSQLGMRALLAGSLTALMSATIIGMIMG